MGDCLGLTCLSTHIAYLYNFVCHTNYVDLYKLEIESFGNRHGADIGLKTRLTVFAFSYYTRSGLLEPRGRLPIWFICGTSFFVPQRPIADRPLTTQLSSFRRW